MKRAPLAIGTMSALVTLSTLGHAATSFNQNAHMDASGTSHGSSQHTDAFNSSAGAYTLTAGDAPCHFIPRPGGKQTDGDYSWRLVPGPKTKPNEVDAPSCYNGVYSGPLPPTECHSEPPLFNGIPGAPGLVPIVAGPATKPGDMPQPWNVCWGLRNGPVKGI